MHVVVISYCLLLQCTIEMCKILDKSEHIEHYQQLLTRASQAYDEKLWNGRCLHVDIFAQLAVE